MRRTNLMIAVVLVLSTGTLASCAMPATMPKACAADAPKAVGVTINASSWLAAHKTGTIDACTQGACQTISSTQNPIHLSVTGDLATISLTESPGSNIAATTANANVQTTARPPKNCGAYSGAVTKTITVAADGTITLTP